MSALLNRIIFLFTLLSLLPAWGVEDGLVVFVPQAKLRDNPEFSAKVVATVPDGTTLAWTGKIYRAKSGPDHFGIINESWVQVEHDGALLWVPRRDCLTPAQYQLISAAHKAGIAGDAEQMLKSLGNAKTVVVSPNGQCAFAIYDGYFSGAFRNSKGLVEWFGNEMQNARWSPDSRYLVLEAVYGPRNVYDMQKERAIYAGGSFEYISGFREEFVPGFYIYSAPGEELRSLKADTAGQIYCQPELWVADLENGDDYLLLEGRKGSEQMHGGAWAMEMEVKAKDVPDAIKATEMWEQYAGGLMVCPMMYDQGE